MLKICKYTLYFAYVKRIWKLTRFTHFICKVFATKILLYGKFSLFLTLFSTCCAAALFLQLQLENLSFLCSSDNTCPDYDWLIDWLWFWPRAWWWWWYQWWGMLCLNPVLAKFRWQSTSTGFVILYLILLNLQIKVPMWISVQMKHPFHQFS